VYLLVLFAGIQGLNGGVHRSSAVKAVAFVLIVVAVLGIAWSLFRLSQMAVISSHEGIVIKNWFRRTFIAWEDIKEFTFGNMVDDLSVREQLNSPYLQSYVVLNDQRHLVLSGLSAIRINTTQSRRRVQSLLDKLEDERLGHVGGK
jgi:hypothetical protein